MANKNKKKILVHVFRLQESIINLAAPSGPHFSGRIGRLQHSGMREFRDGKSGSNCTATTWLLSSPRAERNSPGISLGWRRRNDAFKFHIRKPFVEHIL